jgi:hypothetical protein
LGGRDFKVWRESQGFQGHVVMEAEPSVKMLTENTGLKLAQAKKKSRPTQYWAMEQNNR